MSTHEKFNAPGGITVDILNRDEDASVWIVEHYKKFLFLKKDRHVTWFSTRDQAYEYAEELKMKAA